MTWRRLENISFPQVWLTFEAKDPDSNQIVQYRVQDLCEDRFEEVLHLMSTIYVRDEVACKCKDLINDPDFDGKAIWRAALNQNISMVCFKENSDEICGLSILEVLDKDTKDPDVKFTSKNVQDLVTVMDFVKVKADIFNRYGVEKYLHALGVLVLPKYRGLGLSTEILKARIPIGKALGLKISGSVFTGIASQRAGVKAGFVEDFSVLYEDLGKQEPFVEFPNVSSPLLKFMSLKLE